MLRRVGDIMQPCLTPLLFLSDVRSNEVADAAAKMVLLVVNITLLPFSLFPLQSSNLTHLPLGLGQHAP